MRVNKSVSFSKVIVVSKVLESNLKGKKKRKSKEYGGKTIVMSAMGMAVELFVFLFKSKEMRKMLWSFSI
jgi:hypothetical protein